MVIKLVLGYWKMTISSFPSSPHPSFIRPILIAHRNLWRNELAFENDCRAEQAKRITVDRFIAIQYVSTIYSMAWLGWLAWLSGTSSQFTQPKKMLGDVRFRLRKKCLKQQNKTKKKEKELRITKIINCIWKCNKQNDNNNNNKIKLKKKQKIMTEFSLQQHIHMKAVKDRLCCVPF